MWHELFYLRCHITIFQLEVWIVLQVDLHISLGRSGKIRDATLSRDLWWDGLLHVCFMFS